LIRNAIWIRLAKVGFEMRHFLSKNGELIYTVLYADDDNLKITAEKDKLQKCLNFEFTDIFSLEPIDKNLRPLRLHEDLWLNIWEFDTDSG